MCQHHDHAPSGHAHEPAGHGHHHAAPPAQAVDELAECPVMPGSMAVKADAEAAGLVREHEGRTYWLCCAACGPLFDADPARYATV
jgi:YHS domain-containing protein